MFPRHFVVSLWRIFVSFREGLVDFSFSFSLSLSLCNWDLVSLGPKFSLAGLGAKKGDITLKFILASVLRVSIIFSC